MKRKLSIPLLLTLIASILLPALLPKIRLFPIASFLAFVYTHKSLKVSLWAAALSGVFLDLLGSHPFGLHALALGGLTLVLYPQRRFFFQDNPVALPFYTAVISLFFSLFMASILSSKNPGLFDLIDLIKMAGLDGIYCIIGLIIPMQFFSLIRVKSLTRSRA